MADLTRLSKAALQKFVDNDVADYITDLDKIRKDDGNVRAVKSLVDGQTTPDTVGWSNQFLAIGPMADASSTVHGDILIKTISEDGKSVDDIFEDQQRLFKDIDKDTRETITEMSKTQTDNLEAIGGEKMLDMFDDVDGDLDEGPASDDDD